MISVLRYAFYFIPPVFRGNFFAVVMVLVFVGFIDIVGLGCVVMSLSIMAGTKIGSLGFDLGVIEELMGAYPGYLAIAVLSLRFLFSVSSSYLQAALSFNIKDYWSRRVLESNIDRLAVDPRFKAQFYRYVTIEPAGLLGNFLIPLLYLVSEWIILVLVVAALFLIDPVAVSTTAFFFLVVGLILVPAISVRLKRLSRERIDADAKKVRLIDYLVSNVKMLICFGQTSRFANSFSEAIGAVSVVEREKYVWMLIPRPLLELLFFIALFLIIFVDSMVSNAPSSGAFLMLLLVVGLRFLPSISRIYTSLINLQYGFEVCEALREVTSPASNIPRKHANVYGGSLGPDIRFAFDGVVAGRSFSESEEFELKVGNVSLPQFGLVVLTGRNGAGKSSFFDLLLGFMDVKSGAVLENQSDGKIKNINSNWGKSCTVSYVPQEQGFLGGTLREILFVGPQDRCSESELAHYLTLFELNQFLDIDLNVDWETKIVDLSGGEKMKLSIVRALISGRPCVLMDEPFNHLDSASSTALRNILDSLRKSKLILVCSHDKTLVELADVKLDVDSGVVVQDGD